MKRLILLAAFCAFSLNMALAQTDWKQKMASMTPDEFQKKMEELESLKKENGKLKKQLQSASSSSASASSEQGVVFKVQIGAFRDKDLSKYFNKHPNFGGTVDADGTRKYTLGNFREYWEADTFKKYLRDMGVKDAWIVSYKDGKRVAIKDVLEGAYD